MAHLRRSRQRLFTAAPRAWSILASVPAAAGIVLVLAGCGHITPLAQTQEPQQTVQSTPVGEPVRVGTTQIYKLASPIILQVMHSQSPATAGGCMAGSVEVSLPPGAVPMPCYRPAGTPVTITTAGISPVGTIRPAPAPGQQAQPAASYGFMVSVPPPEAAAVTALITRAYDSRGALGVTVGGILWEAPQVLQLFTAQQMQIALPTLGQARQLHDLLTGLG
jgi:hypothetical protein